jgi:hypothetical protein
MLYEHQLVKHNSTIHNNKISLYSAKDRKDIKKMSENFPISEYYRVDELLTHLSIGEALVTLLNENGQPTMLCVFLFLLPLRYLLLSLEPFV